MDLHGPLRFFASSRIRCCAAPANVPSRARCSCICRHNNPWEAIVISTNFNSPSVSTGLGISFIFWVILVYNPEEIIAHSLLTLRSPSSQCKTCLPTRVYLCSLSSFSLNTVLLLFRMSYWRGVNLTRGWFGGIFYAGMWLDVRRLTLLGVNRDNDQVPVTRTWIETGLISFEM